MKLTIDAGSFTNAIGWATKNFEANGDRSYVVLRVDKNKDAVGALYHSNVNSHMKSNFDILSADLKDCEDDVLEIAMEGNYVKRLVSALPNSGNVVLSQKLSGKRAPLNLSTDSGKFTIPVIKTAIPKLPETVTIGEVVNPDFFDTLNRVAKLCDASQGLNHFVESVDLCFDADTNKGSMFATDRYAMGVIEFPFYPNDEIDISEYSGKHFLVPFAGAVSVPPIKNYSGGVSVIVEQNDIAGLRSGYSFPDGNTALFALSSASRCDRVASLRKDTSDKVNASVTVDRAEFVKAIKNVSSLAWKETDIFLHISKKNLFVSDQDETNKLNVELAEVNYDESDPFQIIFSRVVINKALHPITSEYITIKWSLTGGSVIIAAVDKEDNKLVEDDDVFILAMTSRGA